MIRNQPAGAGVPVLDDDPFGVEILTDPYPFHEKMRDAGPVVYLSKYQVYAMARHNEVYSSLQDWRTFISSRGAGLTDFAKEKPWRPKSLLLETEPPEHDIFRSTMADVISPRTMRTLRAQFTVPAVDIAEQLVAQREFDAVTDLAEVYPLRVFPDALGMREEGRENLLPVGALIFNSFGPDNEIRRKAMVAASSMREWVLEQCQRENLAPGGFGAQIWEAADRGEITHEQAPILTWSLIAAGVDTTVYGIANTIHALARHPDQWEQLHADPSKAKFAFDEALRWESPVQTFFRTTSRDTEVAGTTIPEGNKVLLFLGSANRDPRRWGEDAGTLDINREAGGHVAFGMGIHQCVGQPLARMETDLVLSALAERARSLELASEPTPKLNNTLKGWAHVPVRIEPA